MEWKCSELVGTWGKWREKEGQKRTFPFWAQMVHGVLHGKGMWFGHKKQGRRCGMHVEEPCCKKMAKQCTKLMILMIFGNKNQPCSNQHNSMVSWPNGMN